VGEQGYGPIFLLCCYDRHASLAPQVENVDGGSVFCGSSP